MLQLMGFVDLVPGVAVVGDEARHHSSGTQKHTSFRCEPRKCNVERSKAPKTNIMLAPIQDKYG